MGRHIFTLVVQVAVIADGEIGDDEDLEVILENYKFLLDHFDFSKLPSYSTSSNDRARISPSQQTQFNNAWSHWLLGRAEQLLSNTPTYHLVNQLENQSVPTQIDMQNATFLNSFFNVNSNPTMGHFSATSNQTEGAINNPPAPRKKNRLLVGSLIITGLFCFAYAVYHFKEDKSVILQLPIAIFVLVYIYKKILNK